MNPRNRMVPQPTNPYSLNRQLMQGPRDWGWRFRDFKVEDPCGNVLCFFIRLQGWEEHHS